jgi:hypothetical protein
LHPGNFDPGFASAENALERDLEKTTLAGVIGMIKAACPGTAKKTG